ncbi:DUF956 family protein [Loigolactobacillus zhaoyuanensis]|uniref:DUF956 family protein n=1 Tax=Loigolactobacillus zhaoyuanensis TaxID=2486017 RepID=A0ABW8UCE0_9LACO|nr:DUF956 family protein [Loigolactobacillus zhaoyuanensis]
MVESINTQLDLTVTATLFLGTQQYGKIQLGEQGFEFINKQAHRNSVQLPWTEIEQVITEVSGKKVKRYTIQSTRNVRYVFASKDAKAVLRLIRDHIGAEKLTRAPNLKSAIKRIFTK